MKALSALAGCALAAHVAGCGLQVVGGDDVDPVTSDSPSSSGKKKTSPAQSGSKGSTSSGGGSTSNGPPAPGDPGQPPIDDGSEPTPEAPPPPVQTPAVDPYTVLSPFHPSGTLTYQRPIDWTIAALSPTTAIYYTTDGSVPTTGSAKGVGKVTIASAPGGQIKWIAGESDVVHSFNVGIEPSLQNADHAIIENVRFDATSSPMITVAPGTMVSGHVDQSVWSQAGCPGCIDQVLMGIDKGVTCIFQDQPGKYPGQSKTGAFQIKAPSQKGIYKVRTGWAQQYNCQDALAIDNALDDIQVATIIVE